MSNAEFDNESPNKKCPMIIEVNADKIKQNASLRIPLLMSYIYINRTTFQNDAEREINITLCLRFFPLKKL